MDSSDARMFLAELVPSENSLALNSNGDTDVFEGSNVFTRGLISNTSVSLNPSFNRGRSQ